MLDLALRPAKDRLLSPVAGRLAGRLSADALTAVGLVCGLAAAVAAAGGRPWPALGLWLAARTVDGLDGLVARRRGEGSDRGGYLDMMADTAVYTAVPIGVALGVDRGPAWAAAACLLGSFYLNAMSWAYLSALLEKRGDGVAASGELTSIRMPPGLIEGTETVVIYSMFIVWPDRAAWLFAAMTVGVLASTAQRLRWAGSNLRDGPVVGARSSMPSVEDS